MSYFQELNTKISFSGSLEPLRRLNSGVSSAIKMLASFRTKIALLASLGVIGVKFAEISESIENIGLSANMSTQAVENLSFALAKTGGKTAEMRSAILSLSQKIGQAGLMGSDTFAKLGISIYQANGHLKTAQMVLKDLNKEFARTKLDPQTQLAIMGQLGLPADMQRLITMQPSKFNSLLKQAPKVNYKTLGKSGVDYQVDKNVLASEAINATSIAFGAVKNFFSREKKAMAKEIAEGYVTNPTDVALLGWSPRVSNTFHINVKNDHDGSQIKKHITHALHAFSVKKNTTQGS